MADHDRLLAAATRGNSNAGAVTRFEVEAESLAQVRLKPDMRHDATPTPRLPGPSPTAE